MESRVAERSTANQWFQWLLSLRFLLLVSHWPGSQWGWAEAASGAVRKGSRVAPLFLAYRRGR
jgi:hypothetical protein